MVSGSSTRGGGWQLPPVARNLSRRYGMRCSDQEHKYLRLPIERGKFDASRVTHFSDDTWNLRSMQMNIGAKHQILRFWWTLRSLAVLAAAAVQCNCSSVPQVEKWSVAADSPCTSLTAAFPVERSTLLSIVGPNVSPHEFGEKRAGRLNLSIYSCPRATVSGNQEVSSEFAIVTVPIEKDKAPMALAGMSEADWSSLVLFVGSDSSHIWQSMQKSAFAVVQGDSELSWLPDNKDVRITASIGFDQGIVRIAASFACKPKPFQRGQVSIGTGSRRYSVLLGEMSGRRCNASNVSLQLSGETPFSDLNLTAVDAKATQVLDVSWNFRMLRNAQF